METYTKHIYIGSQRIVSKLGDLDSYGPDPRRIEYAGLGVDGAKVDYKIKYQALQQTIKDRYAAFEVPYYGKDNDDYVNGQGFCCDDTPKTKSFAANDNPELFQYYYHSDHLGSSSLITNLDGEVVQHIEYVPFGEVFIEERNNTWNTPYLFNAKELDEETGLYYYGARYYDPRVSIWLSTDPKQEKYPNISTYAYCTLNPVIFIDPDGKDWYVSDDTGEYKWFKGSDEQKGYKNAGVFKVEFDAKNNNINIYLQDMKDAIETISMKTDGEGKYTDDRAAKFSMLAAESGGANMQNKDPLYDALIISASMDNRLSVEKDILNTFSNKENRDKYGEYSYQSIFNQPNQYQAVTSKSYRDFAYGHNARFRGDKRLGNIGLATVYNAMTSATSKLRYSYGMKDSHNILGYAHGTSKASLYKSYDITYDKSLAPNMNSVIGSKVFSSDYRNK